MSNIRLATGHRTPGASLAAALAVLAPVAASANGGAAPDPAAADKSAFTLFNPTPRGLMREMSTDRPDTTESAFTVDAGHIQVELSLADFTYDRRNNDRQTRRTLAVAPMLLKVGLLNNVDLQLGLAPYTSHSTTDHALGTSGAVDGFVDTVVRLKVNLWGNDAFWEGGTALAVMPYVTFPTASDGLGAGAMEGGVIVPFAAALPGGFDLGAMVQFDLARSAADDRYVVDLIHTVTMGHELIGDLAGYVEYAGFANLSHDEGYRGYFDAGLTYALTRDVQLDAGVRVGLTRAADDVGLFLGASVRF
ncbi:MAG: transporter [Chloroflexi bacterium]|nr:transporter [Chloroflexota bacterium]